MLNRRYAMTLLMDIAQQQGERQFILLTPLDMRYGIVLSFEAADKCLFDAEAYSEPCQTSKMELFPKVVHA